MRVAANDDDSPLRAARNAQTDLLYAQLVSSAIALAATPVIVRAVATGGSGAAAKVTDDLTNGASAALERSSETWFQVLNEAASYPGTSIPQSFDLRVAGEDFLVVSNATKHLVEYANATGATGFPAAPFASAVEYAVDNGLLPVLGRNFVIVGDWELGIDTYTNVIYHAVYRPQ